MHKTIEPRVSGDAYVRYLSCEVSWVHGSPADFREKSAHKFRSIVSPLGWQWQRNWNLYVEDSPFILLLSELVVFLRTCLERADYEHSYIEWTWDGKNFFLQSIEPAPANHKWLRYISSEGIGDALPQKINRLTERLLKNTSLKIPRIFSLWDSEVEEENEPFVIAYDGWFYANTDLIFSRIKNLGVSSRQYSDTLGAGAPVIKQKFSRFLKNFYTRFRMNSVSRSVVSQIPVKLELFDDKLEKLCLKKGSSHPKEFEEKLLNLLERYFVFLVQRNILLNICIFGSKFAFPRIAFGALNILNDGNAKEDFEESEEKPDSDDKYLNLLEKLRRNSVYFPGKIKEELNNVNPSHFEPYPGMQKKSGTFPENIE